MTKDGPEILQDHDLPLCFPHRNEDEKWFLSALPFQSKPSRHLPAQS